MRAGSRISDLKYKLMTIELLNLAKNYYTYRELAQIIGLPETVLSLRSYPAGFKLASSKGLMTRLLSVRASRISESESAIDNPALYRPVEDG